MQVQFTASMKPDGKVQAKNVMFKGGHQSLPQAHQQQRYNVQQGPPRQPQMVDTRGSGGFWVKDMNEFARMVQAYNQGLDIFSVCSGAPQQQQQQRYAYQAPMQMPMPPAPMQAQPQMQTQAPANYGGPADGTQMGGKVTRFEKDKG